MFLKLMSIRQTQIADVSNRAPQVASQEGSKFHAECSVFNSQSAYVDLAFMIDNQITRARRRRVVMHIEKDSDFTRDCFAVTFWLSPDRRPDLYAVVAHHRMVAERHGAGLDRKSHLGVCQKSDN